MRYAGIDAGSRAIKIVLLDGATGAVRRARRVRPGRAPGELAAGLLEELRREAGGGPAGRNGRHRVRAGGPFLRRREQSPRSPAMPAACGRWCGVRTLVDIGGQDSKVIWFDGRGGGARFPDETTVARPARAGSMELVAARLGAGLGDLGPHGGAQHEARDSSAARAWLFAKPRSSASWRSGAAGGPRRRGCKRSIATRMASMIGRRAIEPVVFTGGVARVPGMADGPFAAALGLPGPRGPRTPSTPAPSAPRCWPRRKAPKQAAGGARTDRET